MSDTGILGLPRPLGVTPLKKTKVVSKESLQEIRDTKGFPACLDVADTNDIKNILVCEGLNPDYYIGEAKVIASELGKGFTDIHYITEKISHLIEMMRIVNRFGDNPDRFGTPESKEFWTKLSNDMMKYRGIGW